MSNALRFTDEEIKKADGVSIISLAADNGFQVKKVTDKSYKIEGQGGLYIHSNGQKWNWFSQGKGGGAIQFVMEMEGKTWVEAVKKLLGTEYDTAYYIPQKSTDDNKTKGEFILPEKNNTFKHVFAYLIQTRGIEKEIVYDFIKIGKIFENKHKSCVFVGCDGSGNARYANIRSTNTTGKPFRCDVKNSDKAYPFSLDGTGDAVCVFESPIDLLSYLSLIKLQNIKEFNCNCISLGGVSDKALEYYLSQYTEIEEIILCLDNDEAGNLACKQIQEKYQDKYKVRRHIPKGKDFNEMLLQNKIKIKNANMQEQTQQELDEEGICLG